MTNNYRYSEWWMVENQPNPKHPPLIPGGGAWVIYEIEDTDTHVLARSGAALNGVEGAFDAPGGLNVVSGMWCLDEFWQCRKNWGGTRPGTTRYPRAIRLLRRLLEHEAELGSKNTLIVRCALAWCLASTWRGDKAQWAVYRALAEQLRDEYNHHV